MNEQKPRQIAARVLNQRQPNGEFTEVLLDRALGDVSLAPVDRALCHELVLGIVRWQATLDWLIARKTKGRTQKSALQNLLRLGLYQIFWLDRIPDHAAVNETVELAKQAGFGPQAGFINAVLRGCLREAGETKKLLADLKTQQPALGHSHPEWLFERWKNRWGAERATQLMAWNNTAPKTYARVNTLRTDAARLIEQWREERVDYDFKTWDWTGENLVFELKSYPPLASLKSFQQGGFYIQDPGTLLAVCALDPQPGEAILDLCAAPGGKTTFIAQLVQNQSRIVACDVFEDRLRLIRENCDRLGVTCVEVRSSRREEAQNPQSEISQSLLTSAATKRSFDKVLVDAPCSNTGVMRRRADLRWRLRPEEIERLRAAQIELLRQAATRLKPGGILVYSTCSLEPEENGEAVQQFLAEYNGFKSERERELLPFADGVDGAFVTCLRRER